MHYYFFILQKNKWLSKIKTWLSDRDPHAVCIPFSGAMELKLMEMPEDERSAFLKGQNTTRYVTLLPSFLERLICLFITFFCTRNSFVYPSCLLVAHFSALDKIVKTGYKALQLEYFFTCGKDEVKAWTIQVVFVGISKFFVGSFSF